MNGELIGASVRRKEDFRFLTGAGNYTDDINRPSQLCAYILRSPHAGTGCIPIIETVLEARAANWRQT